MVRIHRRMCPPTALNVFGGPYFCRKTWNQQKEKKNSSRIEKKRWLPYYKTNQKNHVLGTDDFTLRLTLDFKSVLRNTVRGKKCSTK